MHSIFTNYHVYSKVFTIRYKKYHSNVMCKWKMLYVIVHVQRNKYYMVHAHKQYTTIVNVESTVSVPALL